MSGLAKERKKNGVGIIQASSHFVLTVGVKGVTSAAAAQQMCRDKGGEITGN